MQIGVRVLMYRASLIIFSFVFLFACKKDSQYKDTATIIAYDPRTAPCTGGIFILVDGHPNVNHPEGYYNIDSLPASFNVNPPQRVSIDWQLSSKCFGNYIDIKRIRQVKGN
jgi:hypothetical protein